MFRVFMVVISIALVLSHPSAAGPPGISGAHVVASSGWEMDVSLSSNDGIVLENVHFDGNPVARRISVPFYSIRTEQMPENRCEIGNAGRANRYGNCEASLLTRAESVSGANLGFPCVLPPGVVLIRGLTCVESLDGTLTIEVSWEVRHLPRRPRVGTTAQLELRQQFKFYPRHGGEDARCEPSGRSCVRFFPQLAYTYKPGEVNDLLSLTANYRMDLQIQGSSNGIVIAREREGVIPQLLPAQPHLYTTAPVTMVSVPREFDLVCPIRKETRATFAVSGGRGNGRFDNYHQAGSFVQIDVRGRPVQLLVPNCSKFAWDCLHLHVRWQDKISQQVRYVPLTLWQTVRLYVVRSSQLETDPENVDRLFNPDDEGEIVNQDVVLWYVAESQPPRGLFEKQDAFFQHGAFLLDHLRGGLLDEVLEAVRSLGYREIPAAPPTCGQ